MASISRWPRLATGPFNTNVMAETYRRSTLKGLVPGRRVNLERALLPTTCLSGHLVRGVVEGTARIEERCREGDDLFHRFVVAPELLHAIVVKAPVAVDGASFTVVDRDAVSFTVPIVVYSQTHTTIAERDVGELANERGRGSAGPSGSVAVTDHITDAGIRSQCHVQPAMNRGACST